MRPGWPLRVIVHKDIVLKPYPQAANPKGGRPMPVIGTFTPEKDGYTGNITTLALNANDLHPPQRGQAGPQRPRFP
mgnify:CR=1 FL=1